MIMFFSGAISGIISGMGMGGGMILVPALAFFTELSQQEIQGVNLLVFLPASIAALIVHQKNKSIETDKVKPLILFGIIGAVAGALVALYLNPSILRKLFAAFIFIIGIMEIKAKNPEKKS